MIPNTPQERRRSPRVEKELPLKIRTEDGDLVTQTKNISCSGVYCSVSRHIPAMTKLSVILLLPMKSARGSKAFKLQCTGVVVRVDQRFPEGFNIAIFFSDISQQDKNKLSKYIAQYVA